VTAGPFQELVGFARYTADLRPFLRKRLRPEECRRQIRDGIAGREAALVDVLERIHLDRSSPYRALLVHAGIELGDVYGLVRGEGVEGTLGLLHDAGVYVTLEEFKGRRPIVRGELELPTGAETFDNPLGRRGHVGASTSGSRGPARRILLDTGHIGHDAAYQWLFVECFGLYERPLAFWRPAPPGRAGTKNVLGYAVLGLPVERWFTQNRLAASSVTWKEFAVGATTILATRLWGGTRVPWPQHVDLADARTVAAWLSHACASGRPAVLDTVASSGVRVCAAALQHGLDLRGTLFRFGGEPLTEAKQAVVERAGATAVCHYSMGELGRIAVACARPTARDDVHVLTDKLAVVQRPRSVGSGGNEVPALLFTTLARTSPKLLLNVESDDYGTLARRRCRCLAGELGLDLHLSGIRSYEKLTSEGMSFVGEELLEVVERVLPARFGGTPADYQLVEEEVDGLPKVGVVVSPRIGAVDERRVVDAVLETLSAGPGYRGMMAGLWRSGETLRVVRREPYATATAKILPLHVRR
jgi:hypothetical protein